MIIGTWPAAGVTLFPNNRGANEQVGGLSAAENRPGSPLQHQAAIVLRYRRHGSGAQGSRDGHLPGGQARQ